MGPVGTHQQRVGQDRYPSTVMHQPDCLVQREEPFGNVAGDEIALECIFYAAGVAFRDKGSRQVGAPDGVSGGFLNLMKIKYSSAVSQESAVDPVKDAAVSLPAEGAKGREFNPERFVSVIDSVPEEVNVLVRIPHARQFDSGCHFHTTLSAGRHRLINAGNAVVVAEGNGAEADVSGHGYEFRRRAEPV